MLRHSSGSRESVVRKVPHVYWYIPVLNAFLAIIITLILTITIVLSFRSHTNQF